MIKAHDTICGRHGLGLIEVVASTLIVGVMLVAALNTLGSVYKTHQINAMRLVGPGLAQELMAEVLSMPYEDPEKYGSGNGVEPGESTTTRADFDDVDDYDNWDSADAQAKSGAALAGYTSWRREVYISWVALVDGNTDLQETGLKRIHVRVTDPDSNETELYALRWKKGVLEQVPAIDTIAVAWVGAELLLGNHSRTVHMGTNLNNQATDSN